MTRKEVDKVGRYSNEGRPFSLPAYIAHTAEYRVTAEFSHSCLNQPEKLQVEA